MTGADVYQLMIVMRRLTAIVFIIFLLGSALPAPAQRNRDREDPNVRSLQGWVRDAAGKPLEGAVVQLKNTKTLQVRSFITQQDGNYHFHGLGTNVDYEVKADHNGRSSGVRRLSSFDTRTRAVINLTVDKK